MITDPIIERARELVQRAASQAACPHVASFFDAGTASVTHVLHDPATRSAMIVDPVLNFDAAAARISHSSADELIDYLAVHGLTVEWIFETHVHADHLSAAAYLRDRLGGKVVMARQVEDVQRTFLPLFGTEIVPTPDFDCLLDDGDRIALGNLTCMALYVPGHTPADMALIVGGVVLTGDTLFMPDFGTARADFPGGDAATLFRSIRRILTLPDETVLLHCHDYPPEARGTPAWTSTVAEQRRWNVHVRDGVTEDDFVRMREARDAALATPALMLAALQVNIRSGQLPEPSTNGRRYLQLPLDAI